MKLEFEEGKADKCRINKFNIEILSRIYYTDNDSESIDLYKC